VLPTETGRRLFYTRHASATPMSRRGGPIGFASTPATLPSFEATSATPALSMLSSTRVLADGIGSGSQVIAPPGNVAHWSKSVK